LVWSVEDSKRVEWSRIRERAEKTCRSSLRALEYLSRGLKAVIELLRSREGVALDGGSGTGLMATILRVSGFRGDIVCMDLDPAMLFIAKRLSSCTHVVVADLRMLPLRSGSVSIAVLGSVVHEIELEPLVAELSRVCASRCVVAIVDAVLRFLSDFIHRVARSLLQRRLRVAEVPHRVESIRRVLESRGFRKVLEHLWLRKLVKATVVGLWVKR